jgi:hypothetical protein
VQRGSRHELTYQSTLRRASYAIEEAPVSSSGLNSEVKLKRAVTFMVTTSMMANTFERYDTA